MGFRWLGTFRQGQWRALRSFVLHQRRDVPRRISVIEAELDRIGEITVYYGISPGGEVTEERIGVGVTPNSSLGKLLQAYTAQGGNPFDISLFLTPDATYAVDIASDGTITEIPTQPYGGVIYAQSSVKGLGGQMEDGGNLTVKKYYPARAGQQKELQDSTVAHSVDCVRRWVNQEIMTLQELEYKILKLCDLREQLQQEMETLTLSVGGTEGSIPVTDYSLYGTDFNVISGITDIDTIVYRVGTDGKIDMSQVSEKASPTTGGPVDPSYISIFQDIFPEEKNTAL